MTAVPSSVRTRWFRIHNLYAPGFGNGFKAQVWSALSWSRSADEWIFRGTILTLAGNATAEAKYEIVCDRSFRTRQANVSVRDATGERTLQIAAENGRWYENGRENQTVIGALDIDLGWSPSTNTLPDQAAKAGNWTNKRRVHCSLGALS